MSGLQAEALRCEAAIAAVVDGKTDVVCAQSPWPVGEGITVTIGSVTGSGYSQAFSDYGTWQTCNYGATAPEGIGTKTDFTNANAILTLPTLTQCETIANHCTWTTVSVHGQLGKVAQANAGFLFFPMWPSGTMYVGQY